MQPVLEILKRAGGYRPTLPLKIEKTWDNNLRLQGFVEAFSDKSIRG
jgi:hypothetical protein